MVHKIHHLCWITSSKFLLLNPGEYLGQRSPTLSPLRSPETPDPSASRSTVQQPFGNLLPRSTQQGCPWLARARLKQTAGSARKLVEHCLETCVLEDALQLKTKQEGTSRTIASSSSKSQPHSLSSEGSCESRCVEDPKL